MARKNSLKKRAKALLQNNQLPAAKILYDQICKLDSQDAEAWSMLGSIHSRFGRYDQAVQCYQKVIGIEPHNAQAYSKMGVALQAAGQDKEAMACYRQVLRIHPNLADAHYNLGNLFREQGNYDAAEKCYQQAIRCGPGDALAYYLHANMLKTQNRVEEAVASYDQALKITPGFPEAYWNKMRILPVIYDDQEQVDYYRRKYADGLCELSGHLLLDTPQAREDALKGITVSTNFYLQYQGRNDLELQRQYGELVHKVIATNYPQWVVERKMPPLGKDRKIRIGYASAFLRTHNGAVWLLGWLRHRDRDQFEVYCYYTGAKIDEKTAEFRQHCDHFYHIPGDLGSVCTRIVTDNLHVLVYPELGMDASTMAMAGLRLAPVQCVGWGHPITSGLPTMDYWLSSDLMEPENGQEHYTEELIRLPNMANCYSKEQHDRLQSQSTGKKRLDFGLRDDAVLYLCSQSLFKYLPEYDSLFPEIARRVPNAQFVFLGISSVHVVDHFMKRIDRAFTNAGLHAKDFCVMLPRLTPEDYLALNRVVDIFLDNPPWSGNNTTLAAIDCHLPVVTCPTGYMRGRHSYAILKMLGIEDTIASNQQEYVDIAVRLGVNEGWRYEIVQQIVSRHERIYEDTDCVHGLEEFYKHVAESMF